MAITGISGPSSQISEAARRRLEELERSRAEQPVAQPQSNPQARPSAPVDAQSFGSLSGAQVQAMDNLKALSGAQIDQLLGSYAGKMAQMVPESQRESVSNLAKWVKDPTDSFNITPVTLNGSVVGGAHTQMASPPAWSSKPNSFGSLEYAWGNGPKEIAAAVESGTRTLSNLGRSMDGTFADVPANAKNAAQMEAALRKAGYELFYKGPQPPLEAGKPSEEISMFVKTMPGKSLNRENATGYVQAYWSSFASIDGDQAKLQASPAYRQMMERIQALPEATKSLPPQRVGDWLTGGPV